jgi:hypothetical protein
MPHHQSAQRKRDRNKHITHCGVLMLWALLLNMPRCLSAQTVYRCGEHYSASAQCAKQYNAIGARHTQNRISQSPRAVHTAKLA